MYLVVVYPIVCPNSINAILTTQVGSTNSQMISFNVDSKVKNDVELRAVDEDQVMDRGIGGRDQSHQARTVSTKN